MADRTRLWLAGAPSGCPLKPRHRAVRIRSLHRVSPQKAVVDAPSPDTGRRPAWDSPTSGRLAFKYLFGPRGGWACGGGGCLFWSPSPGSARPAERMSSSRVTIHDRAVQHASQAGAQQAQETDPQPTNALGSNRTRLLKHDGPLSLYRGGMSPETRARHAPRSKGLWLPSRPRHCPSASRGPPLSRDQISQCKESATSAT